MARGQILTIPNQTSVLVTTLSREQKASLSMLNPNDGICYVKLNGNAGNTVAAWDWKIPSQSYCQLPGPWESLGVYYLDQSGSGRSAEVNVYELDSQISVPSFIAIGRAVQSAGTTLDISQGSQPQSPPASTARLWVDGTGHLHVLQSNGTDYTVVDSNNIGSTALGGDLAGTISNGSVNLQNNHVVSTRDTGGNTHNLIGLLNDNNVWVWNAGGSWIRFLNQASSLELAHFDNSGNLTVASHVVAGGALAAGLGTLTIGTAGDVVTGRSSTTGGAIYFAHDGNKYLFYDGSNFQGVGLGTLVWNGNVNVNGSLNVSNTITLPMGNYVVWTDGSSKFWVNTDRNTYLDYYANIYFRSSSNGYPVQLALDQSGNLSIGGWVTMVGPSPIYLEASRQVYIAWNSSYAGVYAPYGNGYVSPYFKAISGFVATNGWSNSGLEGGYVQSNWASAMGSGWAVRSTKSLKKNIEALSDDECATYLVDPILTPYRYKHIDEKIDVNNHIGFIAEEMHTVLPEYTAYNEDGEPIGIDYAQITAILWGAVRYLMQGKNKAAI